MMPSSNLAKKEHFEFDATSVTQDSKPGTPNVIAHAGDSSGSLPREGGQVHKVVVIEDEQDIRELIEYNLRRRGMEVHGAPTGEEGLSIAAKILPDLVLLDLMLPDIAGLGVCEQLRKNPATARTPIVIISARGEEADIVAGLERGADDYITKPFSPKVLIARANAVLRRRDRAPDPEGQAIVRGKITIIPEKSEVLIGGSKIKLTFTEFQLLLLLSKKPGWVFTRYQIVDHVRGENCAVTDRAVDVQVVGLRRKLGECGTYIETVRGIGYRFREDLEDTEV